MTTPLPYSVAALHGDIVDANAVQSALFEALTRHSFMFDRIPKSEGSGKGVEFDLPTEDNDSVQAGFEVGGSLNPPGAAQSEHGLLYWGNYAGSFKLADRQIKEARTAADRARLYADIESQIGNIGEVMKSKVSLDIISGTTHSATAGTIVGLTGGAIDDDNSYGGLSRGTYSSLACYVNDNGGTPRAVSETLLASTVDQHEMVTQGNPLTVAFCGYAQWNSISALTGETSQVQKGDAPEGLSKFFGLTSLRFRDIPIVKVPGYTAGRVDFVAESALDLRFLPAMGLKTLRTLEDMFDLHEPVADGDSWLWKVFAYLQMLLSDPRMNAASLQDLDT